MCSVQSRKGEAPAEPSNWVYASTQRLSGSAGASPSRISTKTVIAAALSGNCFKWTAVTDDTSHERSANGSSVCLLQTVPKWNCVLGSLFECTTGDVMSDSDQSTIRMPVSKSAKSTPPEVQVLAPRKRGLYPWRVSIGLLSLLVLLAGAWGAKRFLTVSVLVERNDVIADLDDLDFSSPGFNNPSRFDSQIPGSNKSNRLAARTRKKNAQTPVATTEQFVSETENPSLSAVWLTGQIEGIESKGESAVPEQVAETQDASAQRQ